MLPQHHLRLILQVLHLFWVLQTPCLCRGDRSSGLTTNSSPPVSIEHVCWDFQTLTWLKQHDGLEAGELGGIDGEGLEAAEDLLQEAQVQAGVAALALDAGAEVGQGEQRTAVQRQRPLDGAEQEELAPRLLQQDHLVGHGAAFQPPFSPFPLPSGVLAENGNSWTVLLTWSLKGRLENTGRFFAHFTDMKSSLAEVS